MQIKKKHSIEVFQMFKYLGQKTKSVIQVHLVSLKITK